MKRYEKCKDSGIEWIGEIPEHWDLIKLKYKMIFQKGKNPQNLGTIDKTDSLIYLTMEYLRNNPKQIYYVEDYKNYLVVNEDEILLLWDGSNAGEFIKSKRGVLSSTMAVLYLKNFNNNYAYYFFKTFEPTLKEFTIGMGVPHVNGDELKNSIAILPPPEEQTAIANYLDRKTAEIDALIAKKERLLELYEEEKTAIINELVTGKKVWDGNDWTEPAEVKESGIEWLGDIPAHWEVKKLKYELDFFDNERVPLSSEVRGRMLEKKYNYYGASGIIDKVDDYIFDGDYILLGEDGANLLTRSTALAFKATGKFWVNNHAHILKPKTGVLDYFVYLLENIDYSIWISGSAQPKLTAEALGSINIIVPALEEQTAIVAHIEKESARIDAKMEKTRKLIELLKEYRTALISEAVTGKIKVY